MVLFPTGHFSKEVSVPVALIAVFTAEQYRQSILKTGN